MVWFIFGLILFAVAVVCVLTAIFSEYKLWPIITAVITAILGAVLIFIATFWQNGVGEAKVMVNSVDRTVVGEISEPGSGFKPAWVDFVDFDTFNQEVTYAGGDQSPSYTGGSVNGKEVTVTVGGVNGGSTKANIDATFVYSIDSKAVSDLYKDYRSQERVTKMVIEKQILSITRQIPANYTAIEFRGTKRAEAETKILEALNKKLNGTGIEFSQVTIQDVRYPQNVEDALSAIETANQKAQEAEANQRTKQVEAETKLIEAKGQASADIEKARGEAEANKLLTKSLTDQVLEQRKIDALIEAAKGGNLIVDGGGSGILLNKTQGGTE